MISLQHWDFRSELRVFIIHFKEVLGEPGHNQDQRCHQKGYKCGPVQSLLPTTDRIPHSAVKIVWVKKRIFRVELDKPDRTKHANRADRDTKHKIPASAIRPKHLIIHALAIICEARENYTNPDHKCQRKAQIYIGPNGEIMQQKTSRLVQPRYHKCN